MTERTARIVSRTMFALALAMVVSTGVIAFTVFSHAEPGVIVVVPAGEERLIAEASARLGKDCEEASTNAELADAPSVYCGLLERQERGDPLAPKPVGILGIVLIVVGLGWLATGGMIAGRQPRNLAGWIFQIIGFALILELLAVGMVFKGVKFSPGSVPAVGAWALIDEYAFLAVALLPMLWLLFPDGRPPTSRWRWGVRAYFSAIVLALIATLFAPGPLNNLVDQGIVYMNPLGAPALAGVAGAAIGIGAFTAVAIGVASVFGVRGRFKRAEGEERQQMRWLRFVTTVAACLFALLFIGLPVLEIVGSDEGPAANWWNTVFLAVVFFLAVFFFLAIAVGIPGAYLIAIFRHGLWDLDIVIKKTVQYVVLFTAMTLVAVALVIGIPLLLAGAGGSTDVVPVVVLSILLAAVFTWLRGPARRLADRLVYGKRATPYEVLSEFSDRVGGTYSAEDVLPRMADVLGEGTGAERATIWLRVGGGLRPEAVWPPDAASPETLPPDVTEVIHQGELLGALSVDMPANDPMNPTREKLIGDLASQAGLVLRNVRLIEELRASRQRLVAAQDEERRKLERNIHDGAQQQLVALQVQLKLARTLIERDPDKASEMLDTLQGSASGALEDLRDLARGIYPPLLADQGLEAALTAQARKAAVPTRVEADGIGRYGQDLEATVYFCTLEALNNVAKYAEASSATIRLAQENGSLTFAVIDDGRGFDPTETGYGTGLQGMADRLDAAGGTMEITSAPSAGTTVRGSLPTGAAP